MDWNPFTCLVAGNPADRMAVEGPGGLTSTYGQLRARSGAFASVLRSHHVGVGDRVLVQVDKSTDAVALYLACLRLGAVYVPLNTAYTAEEVQFFADDSSPALFVGRPGGLVPRHVVAATLGTGGDGDLGAAATESGSPDEAPVRRGPDDWATMLYTSGTTGRPKGAMLSCRNLVANARALTDLWRFSPDDVLLHVLPVFHVHGLFVALHCAFAAGARIRLHPRFDVDAVLADLPGSTVLMAVPTHYHRLLGDPRLDAGSTSSMRLFTSGSAPLSAQLHEEFTARTGHRIVERYGMTETMITTSNPYDGDRVAGTVGFAVDGAEVRVVGDGAEVDPGAVGSVEVRGDGLFLGYWGLPERTAEAMRPGGWFVTGDVGRLDAAGRLRLEGRAGDMIITGGLNVYPAEVESVLDGVDGVDETAVVGVPDPDFGEAVVAVVVPEPGAVPDEAPLRAACDAHLARFKHPKRYFFVDALPRNSMGKVQKSTLRATLGATLAPPTPEITTD